MLYQIEFTKSAIKQLNKLPNNIQERIDARILDLATEPRPNGVKKLKYDENSYRIRVGDYRLIYEIYVSTQYFGVSNYSDCHDQPKGLREDFSRIIVAREGIFPASEMRSRT